MLSVIERILVYAIEITLSLVLIQWLSHAKGAKPIQPKLVRSIFLVGGVTALVIALIIYQFQSGFGLLTAAAQSDYTSSAAIALFIVIFVGAIAEELAKYFIGISMLVTNNLVRTVSDAVRLMVIAGIGFTLFEDALFLIQPDINPWVRILSFYFHSGTAALIGYGLGKFRFGLGGYRTLIVCVSGAILLHLAYNVASLIDNGTLSILMLCALALLSTLPVFVLYNRALRKENHRASAR
jgi:RsiW-degrading membrane proteinase PrsW (M82 family)